VLEMLESFILKETIHDTSVKTLSETETAFHRRLIMDDKLMSKHTITDAINLGK